MLGASEVFERDGLNMPTNFEKAKQRLGVHLTGSSRARHVRVGMCPGKDGTGCHLYWKEGVKEKLKRCPDPACKMSRYRYVACMKHAVMPAID